MHTGFNLDRTRKSREILVQQQKLMKWHYEHCLPYRQLLDSEGGLKIASRLEDLPPIAVSLFKRFELKSINDQQQYKVLTSSGTTSNQPSRIFLDKETAQAQSRALVMILQSFIGKQRLPMLIVDSTSHRGSRTEFSARTAGAQGLSLFGRDHRTILDHRMALDFSALQSFCDRYQNKPVLIFGFTYIIWLHLIKALEQASIKVSLPHAILIHSGGWKKMHEQAVTPSVFKSEINRWLGIDRVHDFYGMVEQTGSIYPECEQGVLHCSDFNDILIRDVASWRVCAPHESGVIQSFSSLPKSYPGHNLLTEDLGMILGEDDCPCGRKGKYFIVTGRLPKTQQRGCSDTYQPYHPSDSGFQSFGEGTL